MQAAETERRINQLYNDVNAIYGILNDIHKTQAGHTERFQSIERSLTELRATQMRHDNRLNELDLAIIGVSEQLKEMRVTQMRHENRFTEVFQRLDTHDEKLNAMGTKLDSHDEKLSAMGAKLDSHDEKLDAHDTKLTTMDGKLDRIMEALNIGAN